MDQYIPKDALVAKIEDRCEKILFAIADIPLTGKQRADATHEREVLLNVRKMINDLEVKEVDLDKEIDLVEDKYYGFESLSRADIIDVAKHFFEFGMTVSNKAQKASFAGNERIKDWREKCCGQCKFRPVEYNGKTYPCKFSQCSDEEVLEFDEHNGCQGIRKYLMTGIFPEYARKTKEQ